MYKHIFELVHLLGTAANLERHAHKVRSNGGVVPGTNVELGIWRLGANLEVGVSQGVADSVNADEGTRTEKVDSLKVAGANRVQLSPLAVDISGQKLKRVHSLLGGAAGGKSLHGGGGSIGRGILNVL